MFENHTPLFRPVSEGVPSILTAQIIASRIIFHTENSQFGWFGIDYEDLQGLCGTLAALIGISPDDAQKITVVFSDHLATENPGGNHIAPAYCVALYGGADNCYSECIVVVNRSLELNRYCQKRNSRAANLEKEKLRSLGVYDETNSSRPIVCELLSSWETAVWVIAEELAHAHVYLTAQTNNTFEAWNNKFLKIMQKRNRKANNLHDADLSETTVCRIVLRLLARLSENKERVEYFRNLYQKSLDESRIVLSCGYDPAYTKTGFSPLKFALSDRLGQITNFFSTHP